MDSQAALVDFAQHKALRSRSRTEEYSFKNMEELLAFVTGEVISSKRKYKTLASECHVCPQTISNIASGHTRFPRAATVFSILACLGYEVVVRK